MRPKEEEDTTTNRYVYNRRYKENNASCSYCKWHRNENAGATKTYGKQKKKKIRDYKGKINRREVE
jgi:hypothetical protein